MGDQLKVADQVESMATLIAAWRDGASLDFRGAEGVDQTWVDELTADGEVDRCMFFRCSFAGDIDFSGVRFLDDDLNFGHCNFPADVRFHGAQFPGAGRVSFDRIKVVGTADFSECDFDDRVCRWMSARFGGSTSFGDAALGRVAYLNAVYSADVSFRGARFASEATHFGSASFGDSVNLAGTVPKGSVMHFDGPSVADVSRVITDGITVLGRVVLSGAATPEPFAGLESAPERGIDNPLKSELELTFDLGPLAGESYRTKSVASVVFLLKTIGVDQGARIERSDCDFGVKLAVSGQQMQLDVRGDETTPPGVFVSDEWSEALRLTLLTLELPQ